eukprot:tig00021290_g19978.t1
MELADRSFAVRVRLGRTRAAGAAPASGVLRICNARPFPEADAALSPARPPTHPPLTPRPRPAAPDLPQGRACTWEHRFAGHEARFVVEPTDPAFRLGWFYMSVEGPSDRPAEVAIVAWAKVRAPPERKEQRRP